MEIKLNSPKYAEAQSLQYQMYKKQTDRKKRKNFVPELFERYFRRNEGTTDYATIPEVTLAGDAAYQVDFLTSHTASQQMIISGNGGLSYIAIGANGELIARLGGQFNNTSTQAVQDGKFHRLLVENKSGRTTITLNDTQLLDSPNNGDTDIFTDVYRFFNGTQSFQGILANLKIWDNGTLIRDYPLDDNSDTLIDRVSGQNGTVINGNASDWGLFQQQATGEWLGHDRWNDADVTFFNTQAQSIIYGDGRYKVATTDGTATGVQDGTTDSRMSVGVYRISYNIAESSAGFLNFSDFTGPIDSTLGLKSLDVNATSDRNLYFKRGSGVGVTDITFNGVSVKEVLNVA